MGEQGMCIFFINNQLTKLVCQMKEKVQISNYQECRTMNYQKGHEIGTKMTKTMWEDGDMNWHNLQQVKQDKNMINEQQC